MIEAKVLVKSLRTLRTLIGPDKTKRLVSFEPVLVDNLVEYDADVLKDQLLDLGLYVVKSDCHKMNGMFKLMVEL